MIIKNSLRPTAIRTNSRYRGQTELGKYTNFILETVHDLKLLGSVMDRNDFVQGHKGHTDFIKENFSAYVNGDAPIVSNINTASMLSHPKGHVFSDLNLMSGSWTVYGGCSKSVSENGITLSTTGLLDPAGIAAQKYVEEGDIIYIRMGVRLLEGDGKAFAIGSRDINQGEGDTTKYEIPQNGTIIYIDKRLYCKHREPISINIDVHNLPGTLGATSVELTDVEIKYMSENRVSVEPIDIALKSRVNNLEGKIKNIINNI